jgi:signal transduction histidine kinase
MEMGFYGEIDRNEVFVKVLRETGEVDGMEMEIPLKDGSVPTARIYSRIITLSGKPHAVTMFLDVTEHKRLEARLRQSQKLEAVGTLTGGIAHEFNNIMFIILGNVDLALGDTVESSRCRRHLTTIREAGLRAKDIVERLLRISRKNHLTKRPLDMAEVVGETLANIGPPHAFDIETAVIAPGEQKLFMGDRVQIQQVIFNLYDNATRAVTRGGKVTIEVSTGFSDMPEAFADRVLPPGEYVRLRVSDTGCGISAKHLERVFDPFFTTREVGQGSGLGLSVVLGIVQAHGAGVRIQSEPARGTTVECWFPAAKAAPAERSKEYPISTGGGAGDDSTPGAEPESV